MTTVDLILVSRSHTSTPGGVELLYERMLSGKRPRGISPRILGLDEVLPSLPASRSSTTLVFLQSEGIRDAELSAAIRTWLSSGAIVIELNVFALPAVDRPRLASFIPAFLSWDGYCRHVIRARAAGHQPHSRAAILPKPLLHNIPALSRKWDGSRVRLLRIGRPDIRKWTTFEIELCKKFARRCPEIQFELLLVGAPSELLVREYSLPANLALHALPYARDVSSLYSSAHVYIHYSRIGETYGNTLAEASVSGLPIVCAMDPAWDCAPLEFLDRRKHVISSPRRLLQNPPDVRALLCQSRGDDGGRGVIEVEEFATQLVSAVESSGSMVRAPSFGEALRHLHRVCEVLDSPLPERTAAAIREAVRSVIRRNRGL
jgi:hypothetical protein